MLRLVAFVAVELRGSQVLTITHRQLPRRLPRLSVGGFDLAKSLEDLLLGMDGSYGLGDAGWWSLMFTLGALAIPLNQELRYEEPGLMLPLLNLHIPTC